MTISLRSDPTGTFGAIQVNGTDKVIIDATGITSGLAPNSVALNNMQRTGQAGQVLVSGGPSADPHYADAAGGSISSADVTDALGYTPATGNHTHTSADVVTSLGYTPANVSHSHVASAISGVVKSVNGVSPDANGAVSISTSVSAGGIGSVLVATNNPASIGYGGAWSVMHQSPVDRIMTADSVGSQMVAYLFQRFA